MKQIIVAVIFFSLISCSKKDSNGIPIDSHALPKAVFADGKKVQEFFYDNAGRVVKINSYNDEWVDTLKNIQENTYDAKGLLIKEGYHKSDSSFLYEYNNYIYNEKGELISETAYSLSEEQRTNGKKDKIYTTGSSWTRTKIEYDAKGHATRIEGESTYPGNTTKTAEVYIYDNNDNALKVESYSKNQADTDFKLKSTLTYEYDLNIAAPIFLNLFAKFPLNQTRNFRTKVVREYDSDPGKKYTTTLSIIKKDSRGNILEFKETHISPTGEINEVIATVQY